METISNTLFWISNGLLVPVIVLLLLFFLRALLLAFGFFNEFYRRTRWRKLLTEQLEEMNRSNWEERMKQLPSGIDSPLLHNIKLLAEHRCQTAYCERLLANYEVDAERELGRSRSLVKLGPMLGLMGTLIPMGPALVGLASGDLSAMAYNMQVAFATTVIGLVVAAIGVVTLQAKQRWYAREMNDLEYFYHLISEPSTPETL